MSAAFFGIGLVAGIVQLASLLSSVRARSPMALVRFVSIALVLLVAARAGHVIACSAGWAAGFTLAFVVALWRRSWT